MSCIRTLAANPLAAVGCGWGLHGSDLSIKLGSGEFGCWVGRIELFACWALCSAGCDFASIGFFIRLDQRGCLLVPVGMGETWVPMILSLVDWYIINNQCQYVNNWADLGNLMQ